MTIFNMTGGGGGGDGSPTFKEMTNGLYEIKASDWGTALTSVPTNYFYGDTLLEKMEIPSNFTSVGELSFYQCTSMTEITLPNNGSFTLSRTAFSNCTALQHLEIPASIQTIPSSCFTGCNSLETLKLASSVRTIAAQGFSYMGTNTASGVTITVLATTPPNLASSGFNNSNINKIIVPAGTLTAYQTATNWSVYANLMEEAQ